MNGKLYDLFAIPHEPLGLARKRRDLLGGLSGKILELGAGTGLNFRYYPPGTDVIAAEPYASMRAQAAARVAKMPHIRVESHEAESLPYPDASFDAVVATLALCSVDHPSAVFREAHRVLKPGGRFVTMEHVRGSSDFTGALLDLATPLWKWMSGGCRLNRDLERVIAQTPFRIEKHEEIWKGFGGIWVLRK